MSVPAAMWRRAYSRTRMEAERQGPSEKVIGRVIMRSEQMQILQQIKCFQVRDFGKEEKEVFKTLDYGHVGGWFSGLSI